MPIGTVTSLQLTRGFGFIRRGPTEADLFFHFHSLCDLPFDDTLMQREVLFEVEARPDGRSRAKIVRPAR